MAKRLTLEELIILCKEQNAIAQEELYKRYKRILFAVCLKYAPNTSEAEDNLQDSFITIFNKIDQYNGTGSFEGWMKRITVNTILQKYRKEKTFRIFEESQIEEPFDEPIETEDVPLDFLLKIIQELPNQYRIVFSMYVLDGFAHKEIAEKLGISEGTSKSNLARAKGILRNKLDSFYNK